MRWYTVIFIDYDEADTLHMMVMSETAKNAINGAWTKLYDDSVHKKEGASFEQYMDLIRDDLAVQYVIDGQAYIVGDNEISGLTDIN